MASTTLPALVSDRGFAAYMEKVNKFPILSFSEEQALARQWRDQQDTEAAHKLVTSHLRLVVKIAMGFRGYGLALTDLIAEGNIGLMQAVKKFDPEKGFRLSTYAMWWIKAAIQEYILRSWSLVKVGSSLAQKKLFFNLRSIKNRIRAADNTDLSPQEVKDIAEELDVSERDVVDMNRRMIASDTYLDAPIRQGEESGTYLDFFATGETSQESELAGSEEREQQKQLLAEAMAGLNERERDILLARRMQEKPDTLEVLSRRFGVSRERIRQIEMQAMKKITGFIQDKQRETG